MSQSSWSESGAGRLESKFGRKLLPSAQIGESWEIVDRLEAQSVVARGPLKGKSLHELWTGERSWIFGDVPDAPRFPLLIKLLDAHEELSLQVRPPEQFARKFGGEPKTEFWYVADADPGVELLLGFRNRLRAINSKTRCARERLPITFTKLASNQGTPLFFRLGACTLRMQAIC